MVVFAVLGFVVAALFSFYLVPVMRRAAIRWGVVDKPDGVLKNQQEPVAYLGGVAIYLAFLLSLVLVYDFTPHVVGLLLGATIIVLIGLVDDFGVLKPYQKFAGQLLATVALLKSGIVIELEFFPVWLNYLLSAFWLLATLNALNIIDIMDGLSCGFSFFALVALAVVALIDGKESMLVLAACLAGTLLGFLYYNWHPAKIYLGDAGSMFLGLMLGTLAMEGSYSSQGNVVGYIAPIMILGVPIFDTSFVMLVRIRKGISPFLGSPDHFALRLKRIGWSVPAIVGFSCFVTALLGGLAVWNMFLAPLQSLIFLGCLFLIWLGCVIFFWNVGDPS